MGHNCSMGLPGNSVECRSMESLHLLVSWWFCSHLFSGMIPPTYMYFSKYISQPILSVDCFIVLVVYDIDRPHAIFMSLHHLCPNMFWTKIVFFLFRFLTNFFWRSCVHVNWFLWGTPVRNLLLGEIYCRGSFPSTKAHVAHFHLFFTVHGTTLSLRYLEPLFPTKFHANQLLIFSV